MRNIVALICGICKQKNRPQTEAACASVSENFLYNKFLFQSVKSNSSIRIHFFINFSYKSIRNVFVEDFCFCNDFFNAPPKFYFFNCLFFHFAWFFFCDCICGFS